MKPDKALSAKALQLLERYPKAAYLGVAPLFLEPRVVAAKKNDWVIVPATSDPQVKLRALHSPRFARRAVRDLARSGAPV